MRTVFVFFLFVTSCYNVMAQQDTVYPAGCYMSIGEVQTKTPSKHCRLQIAEKQGGVFLGFGANDYILSSADKCFSKKEIRSDMFAYSDGTNLYLNGGKQDLQGAYVGVIVRGKAFFAFTGTRTTQEAVGALLMGGDATTGTEAKGRYLYVMDVKTGKSVYATQEYMEKALEAYPALKKQYEGEASKGSDETLLKYINLSNQAK